MLFRYFFIVCLLAIANIARSKVIDASAFGAVADGKTDNTIPFRDISIWCSKNPNNTIEFGGGIYLVKLPLGTNRVLNTRYAFFNIANAKGIKFKGNNSTILYKAGSKFGSFNPKDGEPFKTQGDFYDRSYLCDLGEIFLITNSSNIEISGINLDGNIDRMIIGGYWGDKGYQVAHRGIFIINSTNVSLSNMIIRNFGLDGIEISNANSNTRSDEIRINKIHSLYNGRQGLSWTGGNGLYIYNSEFSYTGKGRISSPPGAGLDVEPENGSSCKNLYVYNTVFKNNTGSGFVTDYPSSAFNLQFKYCSFFSPDQYVIWPNGYGIAFQNCMIKGSFIPGTHSALGKVVFNNCYITDYMKEERINDQTSEYLLEAGGGQKNFIIENSIIKCVSKRFTFVEPYIQPFQFVPILRRNTITVVDVKSAVTPFLFAVIRRSIFENNIFQNSTELKDGQYYYFVFENMVSTLNNRIVNNHANTLRWDLDYDKKNLMK